MSAEPLPERSEAPELPVFWGRDLGVERRRVRHLTAVELGPRPREKRFVMPEEVALLRPLVRMGLFSRDDKPPALWDQRFSVTNGWVKLSGSRLSWWDLKTLMVLTEKARQAGGKAESFSLSANHLADCLEPAKGSPNSSDVERARLSLDRLTGARVAFEMSGVGKVGSEERCAPILSRTEDPDRYRPAEWLLSMFADAFDHDRRQSPSRRKGLVDKKAQWAITRRLQQGPLLLHSYLEAENWSTKPKEPCPANSAIPARKGDLFFETPLRNVLDLGETTDTRRQIEMLRRWMKAISARDPRYASYEVVRTIDRKLPVMYVWRAELQSVPYLGRLCTHCRRPDPHKACCCRQEQRCGSHSCPDCQERKHR